MIDQKISQKNTTQKGENRISLLERKTRSPSSRGLGHRPFTAVTGVQIPLGTL